MPILLRVSQLVKKSRTKYRADHGISEDKYIFFIDAGENVDKINFSFKTFNESIMQISNDKYETSFNDQLGSYTITFNTNDKNIIDKLTLEFEGVVETFVKK